MKLFEPGNIGGLELKNRIVMAPMGIGALAEPDWPLMVREGMRSDSALYGELKGVLPKVVAVGDCVKPRRVLDAVWEGFRSALLM